MDIFAALAGPAAAPRSVVASPAVTAPAAHRRPSGPRAPPGSQIRTTPSIRAAPAADIWQALAQPASLACGGGSSATAPLSAAAAPARPAPTAPTDTLTWSGLFDVLTSYISDPAPATLRGSALATDVRAMGIDFPEIEAMAIGAAEAAAARAPATRASHVTVARRWLQRSSTWSPQLRGANLRLTLHLVVAAYIRARRAVVGAQPPPPHDWPRTPRYPAPGPFVAVTSLETETGRFLGLLSTLQIQHPPYGGALPKAVLTAFGALDKHHRSNKSPLWVWQIIAAFQRVWSSFIEPSADATSGFCLLATICIGILRPGFASTLPAAAASVMPKDFGLPALLVEWQGATKARPARLPEALGGPACALQPVVTCVAHDLFRHTVIPFLRASSHTERPQTPLFPRCRQAPDSALLAAHQRSLFSWPGATQLWEATPDSWSHASLTRLARDILTRAGFPDALPFASGPHAGRLGGNIELEELGVADKVRDNLGQWAVAKRRMHEHYEAVALERMARATAALGRLRLESVGVGAVRLGLPASADLDVALPQIRRLGPVDALKPAGEWIPDLLASLAAAGPPSAAPRAPADTGLLGDIPRAFEDIDLEQDAVDEQEAIWSAAAAGGASLVAAAATAAAPRGCGLW
jgi:hypothetical protein